MGPDMFLVTRMVFFITFIASFDRCNCKPINRSRLTIGGGVLSLTMALLGLFSSSFLEVKAIQLVLICIPFAFGVTFGVGSLLFTLPANLLLDCTLPYLFFWGLQPVVSIAESWLVRTIGVSWVFVVYTAMTLAGTWHLRRALVKTTGKTRRETVL